MSPANRPARGRVCRLKLVTSLAFVAAFSLSFNAPAPVQAQVAVGAARRPQADGLAVSGVGRTPIGHRHPEHGGGAGHLAERTADDGRLRPVITSYSIHYTKLYDAGRGGAGRVERWRGGVVRAGNLQ